MLSKHSFSAKPKLYQDQLELSQTSIDYNQDRIAGI